MAEFDILSHLNGNQNELRNFTWEKLATDPGSPFAGQIWENTTDGRIKWYDGSTVRVFAHVDDIPTGGLDFQGAYDANTNTPDLESPAPGAVKKGYYYKVSVAGTFFTEPLQVNDSLFAKVDDPSALTDWCIIQGNLDQATETTAGIAEIATQVETDTGTDDQRIVTPLKLKTNLDNQGFTKKFAVDLDSAEASVGRVFAGGETTFTITHGLNTTDVQVEVFRISNGKTVLGDYVRTGANTIDVVGNGNIADGTFRVVIIG